MIRYDADKTDPTLLNRLRNWGYHEAWVDFVMHGRAVGFDAEEGAESERPLLLRPAEQIQDSVRCRVEEPTWQVFWMIAIEGQTVREASEAAGISYYAAFAAQKRVGRMLKRARRSVCLARR